MQGLVQDLLACEISNATPTGRPTYMNFDKGEIDRMFGR